MNNLKIAQTTIIVTLLIIVSKSTGFLREMALAFAFGTSINSDAFILAQSIINIFSAILFTALGTAYIPTYIKTKNKTNSNELNNYINSTYSVAGLIVIFVGIISLFFSEKLVFLLAPGFSAEAHEIGVTLTRILLPTILFTFISTIQSQQLRGDNIFAPPACLAIPLNLLLILTFVFLTPLFGIKGAAYAFALGTIIQVLMLHPYIRKTGYRFRFHFDLKNKGLREILILTLPIMLGNAIQSIDTLINRILASGLAEGSMAALNFSNKLALFIVGLVSLGAGTVCYTKMSELGARREFNELKSFLKSIINLLNLIVVPATVGMMVLNVPIIKFVFEYGAFDSNSSEMTATALWFYSIGIVGFVLRDIITRAFYAIGDATTPMINGAIAVAISIAGNLILVRFMGIGGLALATSISGIAGTLLLIVSLRKKIGQFGFKEVAGTLLKICFAGAIMGMTVNSLYPILYNSTGILAAALILDIGFGILLYGIIVSFMKIGEVDFVMAYLKRKIKS